MTINSTQHWIESIRVSLLNESNKLKKNKPEDLFVFFVLFAMKYRVFEIPDVLNLSKPQNVLMQDFARHAHWISHLETFYNRKVFTLIGQGHLRSYFPVYARWAIR